jgi:hypothetical protein
MDKRYQVFVSSTYEDLQPERQEVMRALLELHCIPAGMELFPAANEDQWTLIKKVIDDCDYYIVIIGGRYGSIGNDGISYTEMEYNYALSIGKPIIAFLHKDPGMIPANKTEQTDDGRKRLQVFREFAQKKMCKNWKSPEELGSVVSRSLIQLIMNNPAVGWIKADQVASYEATKEILKLRQLVEDLRNEINSIRITAPKGSDQLAQGNDIFIIHFIITAQKYSSSNAWEMGEDDSYNRKYNDELEISWNKLFSAMAPKLIDECCESDLRKFLNTFINTEFKKAENRSKIKSVIEKSSFDSCTIDVEQDDFQTIKIQLRALGLITMSQKKQRSIKDTDTYWTITPYGDEVMNNLRAIKNIAKSCSD